MYIDASTIVEAGKVIGSLGVIGGVFVAGYRFYLQPKKQEEALEQLRQEHREDIRKTKEAEKKTKEELALIIYGVLACLQGMQEQGCNGPVTEAVNKIQRHLNQQAHDLEE